MTSRAILSLCLAALLALVSQTGAVARAQAPGMEITHCTGTGPQTVTLDAQGNPVGPRHPCPDCLGALVALAVPAVPALVRPATPGRRLAPCDPVRAIARHAPAPSARAPPLPA